MTDAPEPIATTLRQQVGNILRLPFALRGPALEYPLISAVLGYWEELRGARIAPARSELDPRRLSRALEFTFIAEFVAPEVARLRIAGRHFEALLGMDPRGMPLGVLLSLDARTELGNALAQVSQGARAQLPLRAESGIGKPGLDGLLVLMPLTDGQGRITRVLGVLETHGQIGRTPRRFRLSASRAPTLPQPQRPEGTSPPAPAARSAGQRPQLRVVQGGRSDQP